MAGMSSTNVATSGLTACHDLAIQESKLSAFSQWRLAASQPDLVSFLNSGSRVLGAMAELAKQQQTAAQLAKTIADKTEAGKLLAVRQ